MPSPRKTETPSGSQVPNGGAKLRQRQAEQQAHQEAQEQPDDGGHELGGGERLDLLDQPRGRDHGEIRKHGEAEHDPGDDPGRQERAGKLGVLEQPVTGLGEG